MLKKQNAKIKELAKTLKEGVVLQKHSRILRERLVWAQKRMPGPMGKYCGQALQEFADAVKEYCGCRETVYIEREKKHACLDCGTRHVKAPKK